MNHRLVIQTDDFHLQTEYERLLCIDPLAGAVVTFVGRVRDLVDKNILGLYIEHYEGMTQSALATIQQEAVNRFGIYASTIIHRVGSIKSGEQIVFVGASSMHREDAFAAVEFMMDYLKTQAPFWKKEITSQGDYWVEAKEKDQKLFERWKH